MNVWQSLTSSLVAGWVFAAPVWSASKTSVEVLTPTRVMPATIASTFEHPRWFAETTAGEALVLDTGAHALYAIDTARTRAKRIIQVGGEPGRILAPTAVALGPNDIVVIADSPGALSRVQYFGADGVYISGFYVPNRSGVRLTVGPLVLNGVGSLQFTGRTFLFNTPDTGALITEVGLDDGPIRSIGALRPTGQEANRALHAELNIGMPLVDPTGGFYFVFQTGVPMFRKYDANGALVFERHIEGVELDETLQSMPTAWLTRPDGDPSRAFAPPIVQTAAVDEAGRLWISLVAPYTYVYDRNGDKIRTIQFLASGLAPTSLFFASHDRLLVTPGCYEFSSR